MKKIVTLFAIIAILFSCKNEVKKADENSQSQEITTSETPILAMGDFDTKAGEFVNKEIEIKGIVDHVCKHGGKKILLVSDDGDVHINSEERFEETLKGSEISVKGVVVEERIDESYCLKMDEDNIKSHSEGVSNKEQFEAKKKHVQQYRDQMKENNVDHISLYSLKYVSHTVVE